MTAQEFTESFGFVVAFLVGCLLVSAIFGEQVLYVYLLLVFLGQVLVNADKLDALLRRYIK